MTSRRRWVPASAAKVKPLLRTFVVFSTSDCEKLSTRSEGSEMFEAMITAIQEETVRRLFAARIQSPEEVKREKVAKDVREGGTDKSVKRQPVVKKIKIGRNDPCPCGSGKKYKNCCLDKDLSAQ